MRWLSRLSSRTVKVATKRGLVIGKDTVVSYKQESSSLFDCTIQEEDRHSLKRKLESICVENSALMLLQFLKPIRTKSACVSVTIRKANLGYGAIACKSQTLAHTHTASVRSLIKSCGYVMNCNKLKQLSYKFIQVETPVLISTIC